MGSLFWGLVLEIGLVLGLIFWSLLTVNKIQDSLLLSSVVITWFIPAIFLTTLRKFKTRNIISFQKQRKQHNILCHCHGNIYSWYVTNCMISHNGKNLLYKNSSRQFFTISLIFIKMRKSEDEEVPCVIASSKSANYFFVIIYNLP